ncbi:hypothetical protein ASPZODRAFT_136596 [Penicilliopsis zonata CBS 506.65]|uniref:Uncharacterized protein n=1 Tax=Penicilliopsis zonata CBS 506.65 TaxID=1073090 RepID=A0A1L9S7D1_9EURO|nr:hypothetical protein ASPZODRAFT_136596 [Penicilliopsis zonata CBS 506.65]OJJ43053.1 hypothetical protein ASPZODRAFT_136596 [Penicilliopsis zonata CBS 506.65]
MRSWRSAVDCLAVPTSKENSLSAWINDDIRPLPPSRRTWTRWAFISFWAINQICLSNWQIGSSLVSTGLSVWQSVIAVILGKLIVAGVAVLNGYVGAKWHIGFPVWSRAVWGMYGSYVALVQRIVLSLVWFATQSYTGGLCVTAVLSSVFSGFQHLENAFPASARITTKNFIGWVVYNILTIPMLYIPPEKTRNLFAVMNTLSFVTLVGIMTWALSTAKGGGPLLSESSTLKSPSALGWSMVEGVSTVVGGAAVGLTNQPDYSRFARSPGDQVFGQWFSILVFGIFMPLFGCLASSATQGIYGEAIWNPPEIALRWLDTDYNAKSRAGAFFAGIGMVICQLAINTVDNTYSAAFDLAALFPRFLNIRRGCCLALILSIAMCPWELLASATTFIDVLSAYAVFLGPMCGLMVAEFWVNRCRMVKLSDLYDPSPEGIYYYWNGVNWRAFIAWIVGFTPLLPGFIKSLNPSVAVPIGCVRLYYLAFPLGFVVSFSLHALLAKLSPPQGLGEYDHVDHFATFTAEEAIRLGVLSRDDIEVSTEEISFKTSASAYH